MTSANSMSILKGATWRDARVLALRNWGGYAAAVIVRFKALAPYALIELILPGGSVMALLLWLYRQRKNGVGFRQFPLRLLSFLRLADPLRSNAISVDGGLRCAAGAESSVLLDEANVSYRTIVVAGSAPNVVVVADPAIIAVPLGPKGVVVSFATDACLLVSVSGTASCSVEASPL
jgi:hypothetical protein